MAYEKFNQLDGKKHDRMIKATIGISLEKFNRLLVAFTAAYDSVQLERCQKGEIKNVSKGGPKGHLDTFGKKLFFILHYLKTYPTFDVLGFHFGFSSGHAHNHVENLMPVLRRSLADLPRRTARAVARHTRRVSPTR
jgi:hypothetical protein